MLRVLALIALTSTLHQATDTTFFVACVICNSSNLNFLK
jgi:hypothetical protein